MARLPHRHPEAVCRPCEAREPCHRCRRPIERLGKFTAYGAVCAVCAPYYAAPRACDLCGEVHTRLEAVVLDGRSVHACLRCARPTYKTCPACHRHRHLQAAHDGRRLCRSCRELGTIPCPECDEDMAAGCGKRCLVCDGRHRLARKIERHAHAFAVPAMANHFRAFGAWLAVRVGPIKAARTITDHVDFFVDVEHRHGAMPDYAALCEQFGTAGLRQSLLVMHWLEASGLVSVDPAVKKEAALLGQIELVTMRLAGHPAARTILETYRTALMARHASGDLALGSVKTTLMAAAGLLGAAAPRGLTVPDQATLDDYVAAQPGQQAAVSGVVRYLREAHEGELVLLPARDPRTRRRRRQKLERDADRLVDERAAGSDVGRRWYAIALELYHDLPPGRARRLAVTTTVIAVDGGCDLDDDGAAYFIPHLPLRVDPT